MTNEENIVFLENLIKQANQKYYTLGYSDISDQEYDSYVEELREIDPSNSIFNKVGDEQGTSNKVQLPETMGSLNKIRPDSEKDLKPLNEVETLSMPKFDGLSMLIEYKQGNFNRLLTRGDGVYGQDITARAKYMNFPKTISMKEDVNIIGEAIVKKRIFNDLQKTTEYKVARNFVGGVLKPILSNTDFENTEEVTKELCSNIDIVAYEMSGDTYETLEDILCFLFDSGFEKFSYVKSINNLNAKTLTDYITSLNAINYVVDGAVVKINNRHLYKGMGKEANGLNPKGARAIKLNVENQFNLVGKVKEIEWNISKRGILVPVVILEQDLNFNGVAVNRISGVHYKNIVDNQIGVGATVKVIHSGNVIPRIIDTFDSVTFDKTSLVRCPFCNETLEVNDVNIYCSNPDCIGVHKQKVIDFFMKLEMQDVSYETLSSLYDAGFNSVRKILDISYDDLMQLSGYQASKSRKVVNEIGKALNDITLTRFMFASGCFYNEKTALGETKIQAILDALTEDRFLKFLNKEVDSDGRPYQIYIKELDYIDGIATVGKNLFLEGLPSFYEIYSKLKPFIQFKAKTNGKLKGMAFCFTGFRDKGLEKLITDNGGEVKTSVSKKVSVLFSASASSTKTRSAEKNGTLVVSSNEAKSYLASLIYSS